MTSEPLTVEATGETVGEAKWLAVRELERMQPGLDRSQVTFQVVSEGQRGLLGVGFTPARVIAQIDVESRPVAAPARAAAGVERVREVLERIAGEVGVPCTVRIEDDDESVTASFEGPDLGLLIGRHGQTIEAIQYLANAIAQRGEERDGKQVVVDAAGYRARRRATLEQLALRSAERALALRRAVELEPMTPGERKIVHLRLKEFAGVETRSEGAEPYRFVVVVPAEGEAGSGD